MYCVQQYGCILYAQAKIMIILTELPYRVISFRAAIMSAFTGDIGALTTLLVIWLRSVTATEGNHVTADNQGYILYCPCVGKFKGHMHFRLFLFCVVNFFNFN